MAQEKATKDRELFAEIAHIKNIISGDNDITPYEAGDDRKISGNYGHES
jgi:hypothetical protein